MTQNRPLHPGEPGAPPYVPLSLRKLALMSLCTFGTYHLHWFYHNWWAVRLRTGRRIHPMWRSLLVIVFCYPMFRHIRKAAHSIGQVSRLNAGTAAVAYVLPVFLSRLDDELWPLMLLATVPLAGVQSVANRVNVATVPGTAPNGRLSMWERVAASVGGTVLLLALLGTWLPEQ